LKELVANESERSALFALGRVFPFISPACSATPIMVIDIFKRLFASGWFYISYEVEVEKLDPLREELNKKEAQID
jgi:hypothetical protein